jgi:hypothetical protein
MQCLWDVYVGTFAAMIMWQHAVHDVRLITLDGLCRGGYAAVRLDAELRNSPTHRRELLQSAGQQPRLHGTQRKQHGWPEVDAKGCVDPQNEPYGLQRAWDIYRRLSKLPPTGF